MAFDKSAYALIYFLDGQRVIYATDAKDYLPPPLEMMRRCHYEIVNKILCTQVVAMRMFDYICLLTKPVDMDTYWKWCDEYLEKFVGEDGE